MKTKRVVLIALGFIYVGLGTAGVVIPVMPTTPFLLLAALCFSASSEKHYGRLCQNRLFGKYVKNFNIKQGIGIRLKIASIAIVWTELIITMVFARAIWVYFVLVIFGIGVTIHLLLIKTKKKQM